MPQIEAGMRARIAEFLPDALEKAIASYQEFASTSADETDQNFKAKHDAYKAALAHIDLLLKLAKIADLPERREEDEQGLEAMLESAQEELDKFKS